MVWVGKDLKDHLVPSPCHGQGCLVTLLRRENNIICTETVVGYAYSIWICFKIWEGCDLEFQRRLSRMHQ